MRPERELRALLASVRALVLDVDGVLTQGQIIYTDSGEEAKSFDVKDGLGIRVAVAAGLRVALMTGRVSSVVQRRARDLHVSEVLQRVGDKAAALRAFARDSQVPLEQVAFMGDDLNDREAMRIAGLSLAPADAVEEIRQQADLVTTASGGRGAAREAIEAILRAQGRWETAVNEYLSLLANRDRSRRTQEPPAPH
jgi:3-deoxy-D-manno-octulosonate 8-phosphate phosphatase (KDO 8-P phosphatase)